MRRTFEVVADSQPSATPADLRFRVFLLPLVPEACVVARQCIRQVLTAWRLAGAQSDLRWAEGDPAHLLEEGVSYVRRWAHVRRPATSLKDALADVGRAEAMPYLRTDVNEFGAAFVELGRVSPETAALIAQALELLAMRAGERSGRAA